MNQKNIVQHKDFDDYRRYYEHECWNDVPVRLESYEKPRIKYVMEMATGGWILDTCCMDGAVTALIAMHNKNSMVDGMDISKRFIDKAILDLKDVPWEVSHRMSFRHGAVEDMIFKGWRQFDCVVCSEAIEHVFDLTHFLNCLVQYGKDESKLVMTTPLGFWDSPEHVREFTPQNLSAELEKIRGLGAYCIDEIKDENGNPRWLGVRATIRRGS